MNDQLGLGTCGATARLPSYGLRVCVEPAGHQPATDQPSTSTEGWHQSADDIRWATDEALAARTDAREAPL